MLVLLVTKNVSALRQRLQDGKSSSAQVFGRLFSDDAGVIALVSQVMPLVASFQVRIGIV